MPDFFHLFFIGEWRIRCRLHRLKPAAAREQHTPPVPQLLTTKENVFNAVASISVTIHLYHAPLMVTFYWYPCSMHFPYSTPAQRVSTLKEYKLSHTQ